MAEDDAPVAAAVPVVAEGLPAQCADPLDERRQWGQHDAGEGPALLGFGERDSAGPLFGDLGDGRGDVRRGLGGHHVPGPVDAVAGRRRVLGGSRSSGPCCWPCGCHGLRLGGRLMTLMLPALARHLPVSLGHHLLE